MSAIEVFISYSHEDEALRDELAKHLKILQREGIIRTWYDREISAGGDWDKEIKSNLKRARIILLLVSVDFIASNYCWDIEIKFAMKRHQRGGCRVVPIILRPCDWMSMPFSKLQALPTGNRPVTDWEDRDKAFADITGALRQSALDLGAQPLIDANPLKRLRFALFGSRLKSLITTPVSIFCALFILHGIFAPNIAGYLIENAKFKSAEQFLKIAGRAAFFNPRVAATSQLHENPLSIQTNLILRRDNIPIPDKPYPFNTTPDNTLVVSPRDRYKLSIETIPDRFYLYVYETNLDFGAVSRLLPPGNSPSEFSRVENTTVVKIPAGENRWRRLKPRKHLTTSTNTIHVLASRWRAKDVEAYFRNVQVELKKDGLSLTDRKARINELLTKISQRADSRFKCDQRHCHAAAN